MIDDRFIETFARETILLPGKVKKRAKRDDCMDAGGRATQDAIAEFTVV